MLKDCRPAPPVPLREARIPIFLSKVSIFKCWKIIYAFSQLCSLQLAVCEIYSMTATQINIVRTKENAYVSQRYDLSVTIL